MTNELLIGEIKKVAKHDPALAQWLSAAVGGVVNKASGENINVGAGVSFYATKWNENDKSIGEIWTDKSFDVVNVGQAATAGALDFKSGVGAGVYASELSGTPAAGVAVSHAIDQGVNAYQDVHHPPKNAEERQADNIAYTDEVIQDGFDGIKD